MFGVCEIFYRFERSLLGLPRLHLFDQIYSDIVKYYN